MTVPFLFWFVLVCFYAIILNTKSKNIRIIYIELTCTVSVIYVLPNL